MVSYKIQKGDNLTNIAKRFNTSVDKLMQLNPQIKDKNLINTGASLNAPDNRNLPREVSDAMTLSGQKAPDKIDSGIKSVMQLYGQYNPDHFMPDSKKSKPSGSSGNYTIKKGDTLTAIAKRKGTTVEAIMRANPKIKNKNLIYAGDTLKIPSKSETRLDKLTSLPKSIPTQ